MSDLADVQRKLEQISLEMKTRDDGLRQAFQILTDALVRMQAVMDDIHAAATKSHPPSQVPALLAEIKEMLAAQPSQIAEAVRIVLNR